MTQPSPIARRELLDAWLEDGPTLERARVVRVDRRRDGKRAGTATPAT